MNEGGGVEIHSKWIPWISITIFVCLAKLNWPSHRKIDSILVNFTVFGLRDFKLMAKFQWMNIQQIGKQKKQMPVFARRMRTMCSTTHTHKHSGRFAFASFHTTEDHIINPNFLISIDFGILVKIRHLHSKFKWLHLIVISVVRHIKTTTKIGSIRINGESDLCEWILLIIVMNCVRLNYLRLNCWSGQRISEFFRLSVWCRFLWWWRNDLYQARKKNMPNGNGFSVLQCTWPHEMSRWNEKKNWFLFAVGWWISDTRWVQTQSTLTLFLFYILVVLILILAISLFSFLVQHTTTCVISWNLPKSVVRMICHRSPLLFRCVPYTRTIL